MTRWYAYVLVSLEPASGPGLPRRVGRTYVGIAVDVARRARQHNGELPGGARSTRAGRPWRVALVEGPYPDRGSAQAAEHVLKQRRGAVARLAPLLEPEDGRRAKRGAEAAGVADG